jgi:hypothetical protein
MPASELVYQLALDRIEAGQRDHEWQSEEDMKALGQPGIHPSPKVRHGLVVEEILAELIDVNREEVIEMGVCDRCGSVSDDLRRSDTLMLCPACRTEDLLV